MASWRCSGDLIIPSASWQWSGHVIIPVGLMTMLRSWNYPQGLHDIMFRSCDHPRGHHDNVEVMTLSTGTPWYYVQVMWSSPGDFMTIIRSCDHSLRLHDKVQVMWSSPQASWQYQVIWSFWWLHDNARVIWYIFSKTAVTPFASQHNLLLYFCSFDDVHEIRKWWTKTQTGENEYILLFRRAVQAASGILTFVNEVA